MAENVNKTHQTLNELLRNTPNSEKLASAITLTDYWREVQVVKDIKLIQTRIVKVLNDTNSNNFEINKLMVECMLDVAIQQFEERKEKAMKDHLYAWENERANRST